MPREKEAFCDNPERIKEKYPDKEMLTIGEAEKYTGLCRKTVKKMFTFKNNCISAVTLAREMS